MTTYKSEMIEFRAGRIILTEAEWTANTNVYPEGIIAITSDGSNAGRTKVFDGVKYWSQLLYNSGGGSGAVTSDDVTDLSTLGPGTVTAALDTLAQNVSDAATAITNLTTLIGNVWEGYITQSGTNAPTVVVLNNTLGGTPVLSYDAPGSYIATLAGAFPKAKTSTWIGVVQASTGMGGLFSDATIMAMGVEAGPDTILIGCGTATVQADDLLNSAYFKITVKP